MDITFLDVGNLLNDNHQLKMISFLEQKYKMGDQSISLTALFWECLLPEWTLAIFMKKYNFTRLEAIGRLDVQRKIALRNRESCDDSF